MALFSIIKFIINHPINKGNKIYALLRFVFWQINIRLNKYPIIYSYTEKSRLIIGKGMTGATGNYYCGLHEFEEMSFLLHFLRKEDMFIDIGANIGSYTVLASAHVGAKTISFEPHPATFQRLMDNVRINNITERVIPYNEGLGNSKSKLFFTDKLDTANHISEKENNDTIKVNVNKLDNKELALNTATLLKMDVEGYEKYVIEGGLSTFKNENLKAMIVELNNASEKYGYKPADLHNIILGLGFAPFSYDPFKRNLIQLDSPGNYNTIYIRDINFVSDRVQKAEKIKILNKIY